MSLSKIQTDPQNIYIFFFLKETNNIRQIKFEIILEIIFFSIQKITVEEGLDGV